MNDLFIDEKNVSEVFLSCLHKEGELDSIEELSERAVLVEGILNNFSFHPDRLEEQREKVKKWLKSLSFKFQKGGGGGWSFLSTCQQKNGIVWTESRKRMEQLICLGMGLDMVKLRASRSAWKMLPGEMPFCVFDFE